MKKIAIAGASGFVGRFLIEALKNKFEITALSRKVVENEKHPNITWVPTDLFSVTETTKALEGADIAIYLVHSMQPSTTLFQGDFSDTDLLLADNFVRACNVNQISQVIYLGGLVPEKGQVSAHLNSRFEVEKVVKSALAKVTILRAGMVVGPGGSSFQILVNLVKRLPLMVLPQWTTNLTQTVDIRDIIRIVTTSIGNERFFDSTFDVVTGETLTYKELLQTLSSQLGKKTIMIPIIGNFLKFSKYWVSKFGNANLHLVSPLVDSLKCKLPFPEPKPEIDSLVQYKYFSQMLPFATNPANQIPKLVTLDKKFKDNRKTVRSIQRLAREIPNSSQWVADQYFHWLPRALNWLVKIDISANKVCKFKTVLGLVLLEITRIPERSDHNRVLFYITGGALTGRTTYGWLEFRQVSNKEYTLSVIHEFVPALPWYIYVFSQAILHEWVC